jgi:diacylglycerol kinase family enzyme
MTLPAHRLTGASGSPGRRWLAWAALLLLALLVATAVVVLVVSEGLLVILAAGLALAVSVVAATAWWAFTTYRPWKRWLNIVIGVGTAVLALSAVARFSVAFAGGVLAAAVLTVAYAETARRALAPDQVSDAGADGPWPSRPWLLVNEASGGGKARRLGLVAQARVRGIEVHVLQPGDDFRSLAQAAAVRGADALGVAGGDGSLRAVAQVAVERRVPFLCVPVGTRNHFAADLGLDRARPMDALAAVDAATGRQMRIDVGLVNGRMFLNNVSLGAYADLVGEATYRDSKFRTAHALLPQTFRLERAPLQVTLTAPDGHRIDDTVVLFVANNSHSRSSGVRTRMDAGELQVSVLRARTGVEMATVLAHAVRRGAMSGWAQWTAPALRVESRHPVVAAGVDGESVSLTTPLEFRVMPRALRVLLPSVTRRRRGALLEPLSWSAAARVWAVARSGRTR